MPPQVNASRPRRYDGSRREAAAARTRHRVVAAARELFLEKGYARTSVAEIAARAAVSVDTLYASVGRKPDLVRAVIDDALGEGRGPVAATGRAYVEQMRAAPDARSRFSIYAAALSRIHPTIAPLTEALRQAGETDEACRKAWVELVERRASNMRVLATDLRETGEVRPELTDDVVADLVWTTNSPEYFLLLRSRGWTPERYAAHLQDLWARLLLRDAP